MTVQHLHIAGYRSIRELTLPLDRMNIITGPNGSGKTNLYRAMLLIAAAAEGRFARSVADEGGMPSLLWAGPRRKGPVRMVLQVTADEFRYELAAGLPKPTVPIDSAFKLDPEVKEEHIWFQPGSGWVQLLKRKNSTVQLRDADGASIHYPGILRPSESVFADLREPHRYPTLSYLRQVFLDWRFYHQFRTDFDAPMRHPRIGSRTPVLDDQGADLAAALRTIVEIGDRDLLETIIDRAFPGAELVIECERQRFEVTMRTPGIARPFQARELSDGTLRFLCLLAAILSPHPPSLLALNEPEDSIHPDLFEPLALLIIKASERSQLWITTHSRTLSELIAKQSGIAPIQLEKVDGATRIANR